MKDALRVAAFFIPLVASFGIAMLLDVKYNVDSPGLYYVLGSVGGTLSVTLMRL